MKKKKKNLGKVPQSTFLFIGLGSYIRKHRGILCVHFSQKNFTDALFKEDCENFQIALGKLISKKWEDLKNSSHFHPLGKENREKLGKILQFTTNEINKLFANAYVCQIALDEEKKFRAFGIKKEFDNKDYFEILLFDPNHLFFPTKKSKYPFGAEKAICLMDCLGGDKGEKCSLVNEPPKDKKLVRKD